MTTSFFSDLDEPKKVQGSFFSDLDEAKPSFFPPEEPPKVPWALRSNDPNHPFRKTLREHPGKFFGALGTGALGAQEAFIRGGRKRGEFEGIPLPGFDENVPGVWQISIVDIIDILSKQFPAAWSESMKTRIGAQKYFLDTTTSGEFTLNIYGSQSTLNLNGPGSSLAIFTAIVRTRPDDSLGLNDSASFQDQIWHRLPSSAIGDTVQLEFTLTQDQVLAVNADGTPNVEIANSPWVLYSVILDLYPSRMLA